MQMPPITAGSKLREKLLRGIRASAGVLLFAGIATGVALSPIAMMFAGNMNGDWSRLGDIGQAYGPISALLSAAALFVVVVVQRRQLRHERLWTVRSMHIDVLQIAFDHPGYSQCWGTRMSPEGVDERLFYYVNSILTLWGYAWENGEIRDAHVRSYARGMFDSEVPRLYWRMHGKWILASSEGRRRRFLALIEEEFCRATTSGPPSRAFESPSLAKQGARRPSKRRRAARVQLRTNPIRLRH